MATTRLATLALAALFAIAAGAAQAEENCPRAGLSQEAEGIALRLAGGEGAGTRALGAFMDGDTIFVLMPRGPALVIPPDLAPSYRGQILGDSANVLTFAARQRPKPAPAASTVWKLYHTGLTIVPQTAVADISTFVHRGSTYVFLAGESRYSAVICLAPDLMLLPSASGIAIRAFSAVKTRHTGTEAVVETGTATVLISPCCATPPVSSDIDPRNLLDAAAFAAHVDGERFLGPDGWRIDWAWAALDAHTRLRAGDLDEARAALAELRRARGDRAPPVIVLLHELLQIDRAATGSPPMSGPEATVRESRARLRTALAVIAACRSHDFSAIRPQRLAFVEVLPPPDRLPPSLAARLALCEAEYLLQIGETRAAVARLRGRDAPTEGPEAAYRLILDTVALRQAGQGDLAAYAAARLTEALDDPGGPPDLRPFAAYLRQAPLDPALVLRVVLDRQRGFGDFRLDFHLAGAALADIDPRELVERLDALQAFASRAPDPALGFALRRLAARRLVDTLSAGDSAALRPLSALDFVHQAAVRAEFVDLARDLALARADLSLRAGLNAAAGGILADTLARWEPAVPVEERQRAWLARLLRRTYALRSASGTADADDTLWQTGFANPAVTALRDEVRRDLEREAVVNAVAQTDRQSPVPAAERRLLERLRNLRFDP